MTITYKGKTYPSKAAIARDVGIDPNLVYSRMSRGYSLEEAVGREKIILGEEVTYGGNVYSSISVLAKALEIKGEHVYWRVNQGKPLEEAINEVLLLTKNNSISSPELSTAGNENVSGIKVWNDTYSNVEEIEVRFNLEKGALSGLEDKEGIESKVIEIKKSEVDKELESLDGNISGVARKYGLQPKQVHDRINKGWSIYKAVMTPVRKRHSSNVEHKGERFISQSDLASAYKVDSYYIYQLSKRLDKSWKDVFLVLEKFISDNDFHSFKNTPEVIGTPYEIVFDDEWFATEGEVVERYKLEEEAYKDTPPKERLAYLTEILGQPKGDSFNYNYEWSNIVGNL